MTGTVAALGECLGWLEAVACIATAGHHGAGLNWTTLEVNMMKNHVTFSVNYMQFYTIIHQT